MAWRFHGKAKVDPRNPRAFGVCDRCGSWWNLIDLVWQEQWRGDSLQRTGFRVCHICLDKPSDFLKAIIIPADPLPVDQPRIEQFLVDEAPNPPPNPVDWDESGIYWDSLIYWD